jgi:hypothetical protein
MQHVDKTTAILTRIMSFCIGCFGYSYSVITEWVESLIAMGMVERNAVMLCVGALCSMC